jgi:hypothetical protein
VIITGERPINNVGRSCRFRENFCVPIERRSTRVCATCGSDGVGSGTCPPAIEYTREFQTRVAEDLVLLPDPSAVAEILSDYAVMRDQARTCHEAATFTVRR